MWLLWKRATAWVSSASIVRVSEAMDHATRSSRAWRYKIWTIAWLVALFAYLPIGLLIAWLLSGPGGVSGGLVGEIAVWAPFGVLIFLFFYCMVRSFFGPEVPPGPWVGKSKQEIEEENARAARSLRITAWVGGIATALSIIGRVLLHSH